MGRRKKDFVKKEVKIFNTWTNESKTFMQLNTNSWDPKNNKWEDLTFVIFKTTQKELFNIARELPKQKLVIFSARLYKQDVEANMVKPRYVIIDIEIKKSKYQEYLDYKKETEKERVLETQEEIIKDETIDVFAEIKGETTNE